jgi:hypothetical protein
VHQVTDNAFRYDFMPDSYADRVQRLAVLYPLTRLCHRTGEVYEAVERLVTMWRARVGELSNEGWRPRRGDHCITYARNCVPSFIYALPRNRPCRNTMICPFCYARWVRSVWQTIDSSFPNPNDDPPRKIPAGLNIEIDPMLPDERLVSEHVGQRLSRSIQLDYPTDYRFHLIERHHSSYQPFVPPESEHKSQGEWLPALIKGVIAARNQLVAAVDPLAAFCFTTVEPSRRGWKFRSRQLFKVSANHRLPETLVTNGAVRYHEQPTRKIVFSAVARTCRYPVKLFREDPFNVAILLDVKQDKRPRLSAMYRGFREGNQQL